MQIVSSRKLDLLLIDLAMTFVAGFVAVSFDHGFYVTFSNIGRLCAELGITCVFFLAGFLLWRTYESFDRNLSIEDFVYTVAGVGTGTILSAVLLYFVAPFFLLTFHDLALQFVLAIIALRAVRSLVRLHFHHYTRRSESNGNYGLSDIALLNMELADLLERQPITIDRGEISQQLKGKRVLVTGAAGSIGSALVANLAQYSVGNLILVDQAETPLHLLDLKLRREHPRLVYRTVIADIANKTKMRRIFDAFQPQIIFHAAAYKHVKVMEDNPSECIVNNVEGTVNLADLAVEKDCEKFVLISSDKAVNPTGVMGCSKRICEIYCQSLSQRGRCAFITTRFGNVLGSSGSVVPIFREQIRRGGPVTLTHPDVIRYFMLVDEACDLVLEAATLGKGGEIFVFDMGQPVRIADLARKMIRLSRRRDIEIIYVGLSPGEKLFEEVLTDAEHMNSTVNDKIKIARVDSYDYERVKKDVDQLIEAAKLDDDRAVLEMMHRIVPEF